MRSSKGSSSTNEGHCEAEQFGADNPQASIRNRRFAVSNRLLLTFVICAGLAVVAFVVVMRLAGGNRTEPGRFEQGGTEVIISNIPGASAQLFKAGANLDDLTEIPFEGESSWLPKGDYFFRVEHTGRTLFYPVPGFDYRSGPDKHGTLIITMRSPSPLSPPRLLATSPDFVYIPSGHFLIGDRLNQQEPHYV
jgi:hypothetical protein